MPIYHKDLHLTILNAFIKIDYVIILRTICVTNLTIYNSILFSLILKTVTLTLSQNIFPHFSPIPLLPCVNVYISTNRCMNTLMHTCTSSYIKHTYAHNTHLLYMNVQDKASLKTFHPDII